MRSLRPLLPRAAVAPPKPGLSDGGGGGGGGGGIPGTSSRGAVLVRGLSIHAACSMEPRRLLGLRGTALLEAAAARVLAATARDDSTLCHTSSTSTNTHVRTHTTSCAATYTTTTVKEREPWVTTPLSKIMPARTMKRDALRFRDSRLLYLGVCQRGCGDVQAARTGRTRHATARTAQHTRPHTTAAPP
jgi:hypothetical protein